MLGAAAGIGQEARCAAVVPESVIGEQVIGRVDSIVERESGATIILRDCTVVIGEGETNDEPEGSRDGGEGEKGREEAAVVLYTSKKEEFASGDLVSAKGKVKAFARASNLGQFDIADYYAGLQNGGIFYSCYSDEIAVLQRGGSGWKAALYALRDKLSKGYQACLPQKEAGIISAMLLGERELLDDEVREQYDIAGIAHLLSISGLHVSLLGTACLMFLKKLSVPVIPAAVISIFLVSGYSFLTGCGVSTIRASIMLVLLLAAPIFGRTYDGLSALSGAALWLLYSNPLLLYQAGFLMSFGAVLGIQALAPAVHVFLRTKERTEHAQKLLNRLVTPLCIQAVLLPIMMWFFYEISLYSILVNLLVLPLSSYVVLSGALGGMLGILSAVPARFVLGTAWLILQFFERLCKLVQTLPGAVLITGRPEFWKIIVYYLALTGFAGCAPLLKKKSLFWFLLLPVLFLPGKSSPLALEFLDVGQGDGIVIRTNGQAIVVDCGSSSVDEVGTYRLLPMLKAEGIREIAFAAATHADTDHCSGLIELLEQSGAPDGVRVKALAVSACSRENQGYRALTETAERNGIPIIYLEKGDRMEAGTLQLKCLHPAADYDGEDNAASLVFLLTFGEFRALLTGDLEGSGEALVKEELKRELQSGETVTVLKAAHHGSRYSTGEEFLNACGAEAAMISCGRDNRYGHPHEETLKRLEAAGIRTYITAEDGAVRVETDGRTVKILCRYAH
ncbi:MAG: DNA internalization-related competence protein ComEC/Rec2 [Lachnospiraceae bacterium]|nr:DNA internalization-related competence protein ComEC/Rec2 [Lachnospiraceae bacterium]